MAEDNLLLEDLSKLVRQWKVTVARRKKSLFALFGQGGCDTTRTNLREAHPIAHVDFPLRDDSVDFLDGKASHGDVQ